MDYVLRSADLKTALLSEKLHGDKVEIPDYTYTAQYLNHQTKEQSRNIKQMDMPADFKAVIGLDHDSHERHSLDHMGVQQMPNTWH